MAGGLGPLPPTSRGLSLLLCKWMTGPCPRVLGRIKRHHLEAPRPRVTSALSSAPWGPLPTPWEVNGRVDGWIGR